MAASYLHSEGRRGRRTYQAGSISSTARRTLFGPSSCRESSQSRSKGFCDHSRDHESQEPRSAAASSFYGRSRVEAQEPRSTTSIFYGHPRNESQESHLSESTGNTAFSGHSCVESSPVDQTWQPGECLPSGNATPDFHSLIAEMQSVITAEIQKVHASVETLTGRVNKLEKDLSGTAEQLHLCQTPSSNSSFSSSDSDKSTRKKRTPIALSNLIRSIHSNLPSEKQLKVHENIDSEHNHMVITIMKQEIGEEREYNASDIKNAVATYRRTLNRKLKDSDAIIEQRLKRSRQQRGRRENVMECYTPIEMTTLSLLPTEELDL